MSISPYPKSEKLYAVINYWLIFRIRGNLLECGGDETEIKRFHFEMYPDFDLTKKENIWGIFLEDIDISLFLLIAVEREFKILEAAYYYCPYIPTIYPKGSKNA
jgi:hypothetical protein